MRHCAVFIAGIAAACGEVNTSQVDAAGANDGAPAIDSSPPIDGAPSDAATSLPISCAAILDAHPGSTSGQYRIDPLVDDVAPLDVLCDMETAGGGWTIVFMARGTSYDSSRTRMTYTADDRSLREQASRAMLAYRDVDGVVDGGYAHFLMPPDWELKSPFEYAEGTQVGTTAESSAGHLTNRTLFYGSSNFSGSTGCTGPWVGMENRGRICLSDSPAPQYVGWSVKAPDQCTDSYDECCQNTPSCIDTRLFSIAVR